MPSQHSTEPVAIMCFHKKSLVTSPSLANPKKSSERGYNFFITILSQGIAKIGQPTSSQLFSQLSTIFTQKIIPPPLTSRDLVFIKHANGDKILTPGVAFAIR